MNGLRRAVRDGVIREYRGLGCRTTEVVHLLGEPRANVQRAVHGLADAPDRPRRALTGLEQRMLAAFWYEFQGRHGINPPPLGPEFLRRFCELCRAEPLPKARRRDRRPPDPLSAGAGMEEVFAAAVLLCTEDPDPRECLVGPARFALLCAGLRRDPWTAAVFVTQHVSSRRIWVRSCYRCEQPFVSASADHKHCGCSGIPRGTALVRTTRLARNGLSLLS